MKSAGYLKKNPIIFIKGNLIKYKRELDDREWACYERDVFIVHPHVMHSVHQGAEGLYLFAKFMPALC